MTANKHHQHPLLQELAPLRRAIDKEMARILEDSTSSLALDELHAEAFRAAMHRFCLRDGKRVRPLLFLQARRILGGEGSPSPGFISVAAALELLHAFILIHDDVVDGSEERRGEPSLHRELAGIDRPGAAFQPDRNSSSKDRGRNLAIICGDIVFAKAQQAVVRAAGLPCEVRIDLLERLMSYVVETGYGELGDIIFEGRPLGQLNRHQIEAMYAAKTTRYTIECPLVLAATSAGCGAQVIETICAASTPAGLAFQIQNDLNKFFEAHTNGTVLDDDLARGKKTLLLFVARQSLGTRDQARLDALIREDCRERAAQDALAELIHLSGAPAQLMEYADELFSEATFNLAKAKPLNEKQKTGLLQLFDLVQSMCRPPAEQSAKRSRLNTVSPTPLHDPSTANNPAVAPAALYPAHSHA